MNELGRTRECLRYEGGERERREPRGVEHYCKRGEGKVGKGAR
jgi:hypothetical protein